MTDVRLSSHPRRLAAGFLAKSGVPEAALRGTRRPARNSQSCSEGIGQELVSERVGLPRGRFVPGGNPRIIRVLIGIGVENSRKNGHLPLGARRIHFRFEGIPVSLRRHRIGSAVGHQQRGFDPALLGRQRGFQITMD